MRCGARALARWASLRTLSIVALVGLLASGLGLGARPSGAEPEAIGAPLPATYFTGSMAPEPEPGPCPPGGRGPNTGLCIQNGGVTVSLNRKFIFVDETITATASSSASGVIRWTTSSYTVSGCQDGDSTCTIKPYATGPAWRLIGASVLNPLNLLQALAFGEAAYNVDAHLVEGTVLVENLLPPPYYTSPFLWPTTAIRFERTNADGTPTDYLYNGLYNVFGQQLNVPPGTPSDGYCYFCWASVDLNGLSGINANDGSFRMFVPTGYYTLTIIRYPFPGEAAGRAPLPGWGTPITFYVDKDTEIHLRRDLKTIEGRVTSPSGQPLSGATITARRTGTFTGASATTGSDGRYSILVERGTYDILTPIERGRFNPTTRAVDVSQDNATGIDFVQETSRINGWLFSEEGPVRNWPVEAIGPSTQQARTNDSGFYELELEPAFWTVRPVGGVWDPANHQIQLSSTSQTASFDCLDAEICGNPTLTLSYESGPSQLDIGESGTFVLTLANQGDQTVTNIVLTGPEPVSGTGAIGLVSGPTPPAPSELAPGASLPITYEVVGDAQGRGRYRWSATGEHDGETVGRSVFRDLQVGEDALEVTVRITQAGADVEQFELDGPTGNPPAWVPQDFTVEVTVTNNGDSPVEGARLEGSQHGLDLRSLDGPIPVEFPLAVVVPIPTPAPDPELGTIVPGTPARRTYTIRASNGGNFEIIAPVRADGATGRGTDTVRVLTDVILDFRATGPNENHRVLEGTRWEVHGRITNMSATETVRLLPLVATPSGNAGPVGPFRLEDDQPSPDDWVPPLTGELLPGDHITFTLFVDTATFDMWSLPPSESGVRGLFVHSGVSFDPQGLIFDDTTDKWVRLESSRIRIEPDSLQFQVLLDEREPEVVLRSTAEGLFEIAGEFTAAFYQGWVNAGVAFYNSVPALYSLGRSLSFDRMLAATTDYLVQQYYALSPGHKSEIVDVVATDLWSGISNFADVGGKTFTQFRSQIDASIADWFFRVELAGNVGDHAGLVDLASQPVELAGQYVVEEATGQALMGVIHRLSRRSASYADDLAAVNRTRQDEIVAAGTGAAVRVGDDLTELLPLIRQHFGVSEGEALNMIKFAQDNGLTIAVRARRPGSVLRLADSLPKPEAIKLKNVDEIDTQFLGYHADDVDTVVLKRPMSNEEFFGNVLQSVPAAQRDAVLSRYLLREEEWLKYQQELVDFADKGVPVGFNYADNGIPSSVQPNAVQLRKLELDQVGGADYYRVKIADEAGAMKRVTGDVDAVYIGRGDGLPMTAAERVQTYVALNKMIGLQHPETFTWLNSGTRNSLLSKHFDSAGTPENLLVFNPNGRARVGLIDRARSRLASELPGDTGEAVFTYIEGSTRSLAPGPAPRITTREYPDPWPWTANRVALAHTVVDANGRSHELRPSRDPNAGVFRPAGANGLQQWTQGRGWTDVDLTAMPDVIPVQPQSILTEDHAAGSTRLEIAELADLGRPAGTPWFQPGDQVAVDPGGPGQQLVGVAGLGSILLNQPTTHALAAGTIVAVVPAPPNDSAAPTVLCAAAPTAWHNADVAVPCTASDSGSGLANPLDASFSLVTSVASGTATNNASTGSRSVCDAAGNCAIAGPVTGLRVDRASPIATVTSPAANASHVVGSLVTSSYACADVGAGIASCVAPNAVDTSTVGSRTFTVTATDLAGNVATTTVTYQVTAAPTPTLALRVEAGAIIPAASRKDSSVALAGRWTVPAPSPMTCGENVTITIGSFTETLPGSRFKSVVGICTYVRPKATTSYAALVALDLRRGLFTIVASGPTPTFASVVNPVVIGLRIGDDAGTTNVTFKRRGAVWLYPN